MKKIATFLIIVLLCGLCVIGILLLDQGETRYEPEAFSGDIQTLKKSFQSEICVGKQDIVIDKKFEGSICTQQTTELYDLNLGYATEESLAAAAAFEGKLVRRGDLLVNYVKAPFTARVDQVFEQDKQLHALLVNYEDSYIEFQLPQENLKNVKLGDRLSFSYNGDRFEGEVFYLSQFVSNGTVTTRLHYEDPECNLLLNSKVTVTVVVETLKDVIAIPKRLVRIGLDGSTTVNIQKGAETESVDVLCGKSIDDKTIVIESGLYDGAILVEELDQGELPERELPSDGENAP